MKTFLTILSFVSALGVPTAVAAEFASSALPSAFDPLHALAAFVIVFVAQIAFSDYACRARPLPLTRPATRPPLVARAAHPLAA